MDKEIKISFPNDFPKDENGLIGRQCPQCHEYFKIKFGTGLAGANDCFCPYCSFKGGHMDFMTDAQNEFMQSIALKEFVGPIMKDFQRSMKRLEQSTRGGFFQIKVKTSNQGFKIKHYNERDLETRVTCDICTLEFAVYGVFASCPDCRRLNVGLTKFL